MEYEVPKVSIIIPVYNVELYLEECLQSVIMQSLKEIEIICVNDGSTDHSLEILNSYAFKDSRIHIVSQKNSGLSAGRNKGMEYAKGKYIYFLDSDDYIAKEAMAYLYDQAEKEKADRYRDRIINEKDILHEESLSEEIGFTIIAATNKKKMISNIIENYKRQNWEKKELIIILNDSTIFINEVWKALIGIKGVSVYRLHESFSLGRCLNLGVRKAKYEYIVKFDDDDYYGTKDFM